MKKRIKDSLYNRLLVSRNSTYGKVVYSQEGEDLLLQRILGASQCDGVYVDVGCNHPLNMSNTALFYEAGWRGVVIDPNPAFASLYKLFRPEDIFINCGISKAEGRMTYYTFEESLYNTFDEARARVVAAKHSRQVDMLDMPVKPLANVLKACWPDGRKISLLSVDCEGLDCEVLESHNFERYPVEFIFSEVHATTVQEAASHRITQLLLPQQFVLVSKLCNSCLFVHANALLRYGL